MARYNTQHLPAWQMLTVSADKNSSGSVRQKTMSGDEVNYPAQAVADGAPIVLGPFPTGRRYEIVSDTGQLAYAFSDPEISDTDSIAFSQFPVLALPANFAIPIRRGFVVLAKVGGGIVTATLAAPLAPLQDGTPLHITSGSADAHVVTAAGLIQDGVTGGPKDTFTFAAFKGASASLIAYGGFWHVLSLKAAVVALL
jgi:hypothetical protein